MKVVKVLWVDSCNSNLNWTVAEDVEVEPMYIDSFGVVVKDTDEFLAIAQNHGDDPEQYSNITTIPKGCIKEVFVIHEDNMCENKQKPAEWSEEDENILNNLIDYFKVDDVLQYPAKQVENWLKSLKPQNHWKPTEEQLASLTIACDRNYRIGFDLTELLKDLKKL